MSFAYSIESIKSKLANLICQSPMFPNFRPDLFGFIRPFDLKCRFYPNLFSPNNNLLLFHSTLNGVCRPLMKSVFYLLYIHMQVNASKQSAYLRCMMGTLALEHFIYITIFHTFQNTRTIMFNVGLSKLNELITEKI